jgi:hypothetical protein
VDETDLLRGLKSGLEPTVLIFLYAAPDNRRGE